MRQFGGWNKTRFITLLPLVFLLLLLLTNPFYLLTDNSEKTGVKLEAEKAKCVDASGKVISGSKVADKSASGGYYMGSTANKGFIFENVPLSNKVSVKYASGFSSYIVIYVEVGGVFKEVGQICFSTTQSWAAKNQWIASSDVVNIPAGATVKFVPSNDIDLDYFLFSSDQLYSESNLAENVVLAKNAMVSGGTEVDDIMAYVGKTVKLANTGSSVAFSVPKTKDDALNVLNIRYKAETVAQIVVSVNGTEKVKLSPEATSVGTYTEIGTKISTYHAGDTITVTSDSSAILYLDNVRFNYMKEVDVVNVTNAVIQASRTEISLDGIWACDTTTFRSYKDLPDSVPDSLGFANSIPVPGMWDLAGVALGEYDGKALWQKKTVVLEAEPTGEVLLKINRAYFGRYIYVNGVYVGEYQYNYTNSLTDITKYLHKGENGIVIMLGNYSQQINEPSCPAHVLVDGEKKYNYSGIVDSVTLIFNNTPIVTAVQTAPNLESGSIDARVTLWNTTDSSVTTDVTYNIYELGVFVNGVAKQEKKLITTYTQSGVTVASNGTITAETVTIALSDFDKSKYWTPENPYLYEIEVITSGDTYSSRFGMRTFYFDANTKLPMLNGKAYYLRGTNVALHRFYDDVKRGTYPWQKDWVRLFYQELKSVNWNVLRFSLGSAPSIWYDIADEEGFLVVDEYAWWGCGDGCTVKTLMPEVYAWMDEKCNHPSVIIWDMNNEDTSNNVTNKVIQTACSYDIQKRPWDNGWSTPQSETDTFECHPYKLGAGFLLPNLNGFPNTYENPPSIIPDNYAPNNPKILNEYDSIWLNRDGDATTTGIQAYYDAVMEGNNSSDRIGIYANSMGQITEFWRAGRHFKGIMQFCALTYSRPTGDGVTGDILMPDISTPRIHPEIKESFKNAFAPLGIVIADWSDTCVRGENRNIPITLINDLNEEIKDLKVTFKIYKGEKVIQKTTATYDLMPAGDTGGKDVVTKVMNLTVPAYNTDKYTVMAEYTRNKEITYSKRVWMITGGEIKEPLAAGWIVLIAVGALLAVTVPVVLIMKSKKKKVNITEKRKGSSVLCGTMR